MPRSVVDVTLRMRRMRSRILIIRKIGLIEAKEVAFANLLSSKLFLNTCNRRILLLNFK